jgi:hypothetical protein
MPIFYVSPHNVITRDTFERDVLKQVTLLNAQGQIEPLVVDRVDREFFKVDDTEYPYASAQVQAARRLGWDTIIVTDERD